MVYVQYRNSIGKHHLKKQCFACGELESNFYSKSKVDNFNSLPEADMDAAHAFQFSHYESLSEIYKRYDEKRKKFQKEQSLDKFLEEHTEYLLTDEWKKRRELVLKRDNFVCQSCLEKKATQVHHKSYRYWKNEPLFELVSVCHSCHEAITEMNREAIDFSRVIRK
ncbi:HNH endonuclease [Pontibacter harenae]|uniref:HNH endonuclease n=1 Tax=Pontibacter harenae TaxID=2894083 RepID=UPI001E2980F0|nr:hypothetical protein [Pontibacter harenae]